MANIEIELDDWIFENRFAFNSYDSILEWHTTLDIIFIQRGTIDIKDMIIVEVNFDNNLYRKTTCITTYIFWEIRKSIISLFRRTMYMSRQTMLRRTAKEMIHPQGTRNPMKRDAHETRCPWNKMKWTNYRMCTTARTKRRYEKWSLSR